jgi:hypothetical protein
MRADLKSIKLLFKAKTQPANSNSSQRGDEQHITEIDRGCIAKKPKLLIWSKNTYKQNKKPELEGEDRSGE